MGSATDRTAVGCHVFAGGFAGGFKEVFDVQTHLECHGFGLDTARHVWGVPDVINTAAADWPKAKGDVLYGNPRCTAFSSSTCGLSETGHGPRARACRDVIELTDYGLGRFPIVVWESVQQAYSVGKPLLDEFTARAVSLGYRVAHVFVNAATFGVPQQRKRYFQVFYDNALKFNVDVPCLDPDYAVLYDAIWDLRNRETRMMRFTDEDYDRDCWLRPAISSDLDMFKVLPSGWSTNLLAKWDYHSMPEYHRHQWDVRVSDMPFSLHAHYRCAWMRHCPTLMSSSVNLVHPWHHRTLTVGELARCMGWGDRVPVGRRPVAQLAKGVCPAVGRWIAEQCLAALEDKWNGQEWTTRYNSRTGVFEGEDSAGMDEKVIDVTEYCGKRFTYDRFPDECKQQHHRFNVDSRTGKLLRPWRSRVSVD